jgi:hypothetical protein
VIDQPAHDAAPGNKPPMAFFQRGMQFELSAVHMAFPGIPLARKVSHNSRLQFDAFLHGSGE